MRNLRTLDCYRDCSAQVIRHYGNVGDETCGVFTVPSPTDGQALSIVASCGGGWEHVSVSRTNRCPNWPEMEKVKRLFFRDDEVAMQLHVAVTDHISVHPYCLHIWRPIGVEIPLPHKWMVALPEDVANAET